MKIAKPLLLVLTPIGVGIGLYEAWRLAGGLAFLMATMVMVIGFGLLTVILTIRRERKEQREAREEADALARMATTTPPEEAPR